MNGSGTERLAATIEWQSDPANPVISLGTLNPGFDDDRTNSPAVIRLGGTYRLFYCGRRGEDCFICSAESPAERPNDWRGLGCIVGPQKDDPTRACGARWPWAIALDGRTIFVYYLSRGVQTADKPFPNTPRLIISEDAGATWREPSPDPFIGMDRPYDRETIGSHCVVRVGDRFHLYYTAAGDYRERPAGEDVYGRGPLVQIGIGLAVSDDGLSWEKPYDHFLIPPRLFATEPYETKVAIPCVVRDGHLWRMWVGCLARHYRTCSLVSRDAIHWHWQPTGTAGDLGLGAPGAFDSEQRCHAMVVKHGDAYRCWYVGNGFGATGIGYCRGVAGSV